MRPAALLFALLSVVPARAADRIDFRTQVYPLLHDKCFRCHQGADAKSGVRLDQHAEVVGRSKLVVELVSGADPDRVMPPKGERLSAAEVKLLRAWVEQGVAWDGTLLPPESAKSKHWAFQPVTRPVVPTDRSLAWVRNPIDAFIAAEHEAKGIAPAPVADRRTLLRRLALDLTGLPPTPDAVTAFEADNRSDAYERQVERLLASPAYGERWGRHWLDLTRYADSEGYESDHVRPYAWRYRDYVIQSFNADTPFDRYVREQLAGDELTPYRDENLIATGFLAAARLSSNEEDRSRQLNDLYVDIVNATGGAMLGLTVQCAQCHAHKFDPVSHQDYYRLQGFFLSGLPYNFVLRDPAGRKAHASAKPPGYDHAKKLVGALSEVGRARLDAQARRSLTPEEADALAIPADRRTPKQHEVAVVADLKFQHAAGQIFDALPTVVKPLYAKLREKVSKIEERLPDPPQTFGFYSPVTSPHTIDWLPMKGFYPPKFDRTELAHAKPFVLLAGDSRQRGEPLTPGWPAVFGPTPPEVAAKPTRLALANWLTDAKHPLTARVWANRVWQWHFGRGIVDTPSDFGVRGAPPSHPELLDWLASEFVDRGWSTKHLHRLIVTSATYRQSSIADPKSKTHDPDNVLLSRWTPRRAEAEVVRDAMLAVSGELDRTVGGAPQTDEVKSVRRGVYLLHKRQKPAAALALFDGPEAATESCPKRLTTATPLHALHLLNNEFPAKRAKALAERVRREAGNVRGRQVEAAFRLAFQRSPSEAERQSVADFFAAHPADPLADLCHALFAATEFLTLE